ncbi:hypothetical protein GW916_14080 [bacterium]|nr:hypothetical protein [bacterium]
MLTRTQGCAAEPINPTATVNTTTAVDFGQIRLAAQLDFFLKGRAGCAFVALAAKNPQKYGWTIVPTNISSEAIDHEIEKGINDEATSTLSLVFPSVTSELDFRILLSALLSCKNIYLGQDEMFNGARCLGFRVAVGELSSWASGFANFHFMPLSRRAPCVEIAFRVKPRPNYREVLKEAPKGTIHLADMDMLGMASASFKFLWKKSHEKTMALLGHAPDLRSAAKTTFAIPSGFLS